MRLRSLTHIRLLTFACAAGVTLWSSAAQGRPTPLTRSVAHGLGCPARGGTQKPRLKYRVASDTVQVFGDGRFQIARVYKGYGLFDSTSSAGVAMNVSGWVQKGRYGYVIGEEGFQPGGKVYHRKFFLLDLSAHKLTKYSRLAKIPAKHRQVFSHLQEAKRIGA